MPKKVQHGKGIKFGRFLATFSPPHHVELLHFGAFSTKCAKMNSVIFWIPKMTENLKILTKIFKFKNFSTKIFRKFL